MDIDLTQYVQNSGALMAKPAASGEVIGVTEMTFGKFRVTIGDQDGYGYRDGY